MPTFLVIQIHFTSVFCWRDEKLISSSKDLAKVEQGFLRVILKSGFLGLGHLEISDGNFSVFFLDLAEGLKSRLCVFSETLLFL
jgi:hypothetical protein